MALNLETIPSTYLMCLKPFFFICRFASHPNRNLLAKFDQCGRTDILGQIVNGVEAAIGEFPW